VKESWSESFIANSTKKLLQVFPAGVISLIGGYSVNSITFFKFILGQKFQKVNFRAIVFAGELVYHRGRLEKNECHKKGRKKELE
jgi:hypothetical protein